MDIIMPPIIRVGNRMYRKNPSRNTTNTIPIGHLDEDFFTDCHEECSDDYASATELHSPDTSRFPLSLVKSVQMEGGKCVGSVYVPKPLHKSLTGSKKKTQRRIEEDLKCRLLIPSPSSTDTHIKITANSENGVEAVVNRVEWIVTEARRNHPPSHFICLPVLNRTLQDAYCLFKDQVLNAAMNNSTDCGDYASIDKDLFVSEKKLHFTLATLFLADHHDVMRASELLGKFIKTESGRLLSDNSPLRLTIRGFDCMNDDPKCVRVLHATLAENAETQRLQTISNGLADLFTEQGFHSGNRHLGDVVKLHMTVLNSRLRCQRLMSRCPPEVADSIQSEAFCAVGILRDFGNRTLVENVPFEEFQLCNLRPETESNVSFYPCEAKLNWVCEK